MKWLYNNVGDNMGSVLSFQVILLIAATGRGGGLSKWWWVVKMVVGGTEVVFFLFQVIRDENWHSFMFIQ